METGPDLVQSDNVSISPELESKDKKPEKPKAVSDKEVDEEVEAKPPRKQPAPLGPDAGKVLVVQPDKIEKARASQVLKKRGDYVFPEIKMLNEPSANSKLEPEDFRKRAADLIETLKQFKVDCVPVDPANGVSVAVIGAGGIEKVIDIKLGKDEQAMFDKSVEAVKGLVEACKGIDSSLA